MTATFKKDDDRLIFSGDLDRAAATWMWPQLTAQMDGVRHLSLSGVTSIDSAGLAMLAEMAAQLRTPSGSFVNIEDEPSRMTELRAAYRLGTDLDFIRSHSSTS